MKRSLTCTSAAAVPFLFVTLAFAQTATTPSNNALPPAAPPGAVTGPIAHPPAAADLPHAGAVNLSAADQAFVQKAAQGGLAEVQLAQLAQQKTASDQVKQFAQKMIDDHTPNNQKLVQLVTSMGVTPPSEPNVMQQKMAAHLETLTGQKFDRSYITGQIRAHTMMLKLFQAEASDGQDSQLKTFAEQTVPVIQQHLSMAHELQKAGA